MQLYTYIRSLIQDGAIQDGAKLPSIRSLKRQLNISKTTIETAYHMLLEEGYVFSKQRSGLIVVNPHLLQSPNQSSSIKQADTVPSLTQVGIEDLIDFSLLTVDGDSFPIRIWKSIMGESLSMNCQFIHEYGESQGEYSLRESISIYLRNSRGVTCSPEQIVIGSGISYSVQLLSRLIGERSLIGIEKHGIAQVRQVFSQNNFHLIPISIYDDELFEKEIKENKINVLYVTPSHRPMGSPMPFANRQQMLQWAIKNNGYIIEDDYDGELRLTGKPVPSLQGLDKDGVVIYIGTFSKVFTPAIRLNYMVLPQSLLEKLQSLDTILSGPSRIDQWAMQLFISRGHWYRHLRRMRKIYRLKHDFLVQLLQRHMPGTVRVEFSGSGLHLEMTIRTKLSTEKLIELARNEGVVVYGSQDALLHTDQGEVKIYLGFGGIQERDMERGILLLKKAWSEALNIKV
ncbi:aminotransferase class I/II-fold pyridoxal phosphate-dependent enzyme [Paenibacillus sp. LMG 31461]|uniref:Aminotransferase class I/II-fold pyridoxal phosphate-dependent enzyme n=1 Tax=Paenibacillus plantarum TaxID=2654975 RepID=A0ABX1XH76_9BACL|nr:PLP-dependent aminotransferase family protein [Paenibacillus plantarum]NOU67787.1 aminotransferase class I/II-fold pyridoxal phosphate-dependent enzyme [Paenibacillus plantarum]